MRPPAVRRRGRRVPTERAGRGVARRPRRATPSQPTEPAGDRPTRAYTARPVRLSRVMRATAWGIVAIGAAAPLARKRVKAPPVAVQAVAYAAPLGLCVAVRRSRRRDAAVCALQMWAYIAAYK